MVIFCRAEAVRSYCSVESRLHSRLLPEIRPKKGLLRFLAVKGAQYEDAHIKLQLNVTETPGDPATWIFCGDNETDIVSWYPEIESPFPSCQKVC